ncbi:MAG: hypothetical protein ACLQDF_06970 [Desulfomonilia bacterium]
MPGKKICFVIMPFSMTTKAHTREYWTSHFREFLKPIIEETGTLEARRSTAMRGDIIKDIITNLVVSPIVVAELTDANPNVYWELGVRQSFKHCTVSIAEDGTKLPFDVSMKGTLFYNPKNHINIQEFRSKFKDVLNDCLSQPGRPDSHVLETITGRGSIYEIIRKDEAIRRVNAILDEIKYNKGHIINIIEQSKKNQKNKEERFYLTNLLRLSSCELLMTTRYLDQEKSFYELLEQSFGSLASWNTQTSLWEHSPDSTERWFIKDYDSIIKSLRQLEELLTKYYPKLISGL